MGYRSGISILAISVSAIIILYSIAIFPIPSVDSIVFMPAAFFYSKGEGFINPIYYVTDITDPTGASKFNYYPPLFPWIIGWLSKVNPSIKTTFVVCGLFNCLSISLYAGHLRTIVTNGVGRLLKIIFCISIVYAGIYFMPTAGRPECFTVPLTFCVYLLRRNRQKVSFYQYNALLCLLFSFILTSQIVGFYFCFLFLVIDELLSGEQVKTVVTVNLVRAITILMLCALILFCSPNGLEETLTGTWYHIKFVSGRSARNIMSFAYFWFASPRHFGFGGVFFLAVALYLSESVSRYRNLATANKIFLGLASVFVVAGFSKFVLYASPTIYNTAQFILVLSAYVLRHLVYLGGRKAIFRWTALFVYTAGTIVFMRIFLLFIDNTLDGKTYNAARKEISRFRPQNPNIFVSNLTWPLFDNLRGLKIIGDFQREHKQQSGDTLILSQAYHPRDLSEKYTLLYDWRTSDKRKIMGIPISKTAHGYSFVVCRVE